MTFDAWHLFLQADIVVKMTMLLLVAASIWSWAIIIDKLIRFRRVRQRMDAFEETFWSGYALDDLFDRVRGRADHPLAFLFISAMRAWRRSAARGPRIPPPSVRDAGEK